MSILSFYKQYPISSVIMKLSTEVDDNKRKKYENILFAWLISSALLVASLVSWLVGSMWDEVFLYRIIRSLTMIGSAFGNLYFIQKNLSETTKRHIISFFLSITTIVVYITFFDHLKILIWFFIVVQLFASVVNSNILSIYYLVVLSVFFLLHGFIVNKGDVIYLDQAFYFSIAVMLIFNISISVVINRFYNYILKHLADQYQKAINDNEEISGLYEEITASEEELRERNEEISGLYQEILASEEELRERNEEISGLYEEILASEEELRDQNEQLNTANEELIRHQERLNFLAYKDTLTGLPNRKMILEQLDILANLQGEDKDHFALVFIDLDNFKNINDTMGHSVGDELLIRLANRLSHMINKIDLIGRLGGDEFALLVRRHISEESLMAYLQQLLETLTEPFKLNNYEVSTSASFGVALWPMDGRTSEELLKAADTAMYKAKATGKNDIQFFRESMKQEILERIEMEYQLLKALENSEFFIEYQPLIDVTTKKAIGFEALLRWQSPKYGRVAPLRFIPLAEDLGLIYEIGKRVFREVCRVIKDLEACCKYKKIITVNVSAIQLQHPNFLKDLRSILEEYQVEKGSIELEITESVFIDDIKKTTQILNEVKQMGMLIAVDDFGTGYSSLSYILSLPIDTLKIDKSFIDGIDSTSPNKNIVGSIINLAHGLDMNVVAEGVEDVRQVAYLEENKCDIIQGYYFSKPVSEAEIRRFIVD